MSLKDVCLTLTNTRLSLDGGKPASVSMASSSHQVRTLLSHPARTPLDLRLFAQVELNALRAEHYSSVTSIVQPFTDDPYGVTRILTSAEHSLDVWLSEWQKIVTSESTMNIENPLLSLNLRIQHAWAILALHLRALTTCGIENIALMTPAQRSIALAAKTAAERHLQLLLTSMPSESEQSSKPYIANFRFASEFVWAKNTFCVFIVLRLGVLLGDPLSHLIQCLCDANQFLRELEKVGMGANISYMRILAQTVEKCEKAVKASMAAGSATQAEGRESKSASDFESFVPKEFMFAWDFPGLNLCYVPLDWQDLFLDFSSSV